MLRRLLPLALTAALFCPITTFAQTVPAPTVPAAPIVTPDPAAAAPAPKNADRVGGKISAIDAAAKTITLSHGKKTVTLSVPDGTKIYKVGDAKGQPTGTFADLVLDTRISAMTNGDATTPVAKTVHIRAPKTAVPAAPATP
ncbi:MAG: hypothetical protein ACRYFS_23395 [Janthinobacterium lividum]